MAELVEPKPEHDDEIFIPVIGYEEYYLVSNYGRVFSRIRDRHRRGRFLSPAKSRNGYLKVALSKNGSQKVFYIHRLVGTAFIENSHNKKTINHKNGIKEDNRAVNLEWATRYENTIHAKINGLYQSGENRHNSVLKQRDIEVILKLYLTNKLYISDIANAFGVSGETIGNVIKSKTWNNIGDVQND